MKILDWYILKKFLSTFVFTVFILLAVLIVIDMSEKIEDFNHPELTFWIIVRDYYLNFIPYYANMLSPLIVFISAVFVTAKLASHTEIVAILSAGNSLKRILVPYFIGACMIAVLVFFLINWVIPDANKVRHNFENTYVRKQFYFSQRNVHLKIAPEIYVYLESYDNISHTGYRFTMERIKGTKLLSKLEANKITWSDSLGKWHLPNYTVRYINGTKEQLTQGNALDTLIGMRPKDFESKHLFNEQLTLPELNEYIALLRLRGADNVERYLVEKYERLAYPFAIIILTVIGVVVSSRKSREGTGFQIAFGFVLAFVYILLIIMSRSFAQKGGIPPQLSAWIPNTLFIIIGYIMYLRTPK